MSLEKEETELYEIVEPYLIDNAQSNVPLVNAILEWRKKHSYNEKVKEFMVAANQPINEYPTNENKVRGILRLSLILEELGELAEGIGQVEAFKDLLRTTLFKNSLKDKNNMLDTLDALADLQYVLTGAIHEFGFGNFINKAFNEVHNSNMSKFSNNEEEAENTLTQYLGKGVQCYNTKIGDVYVTFRVNDDKVLKSVNFQEPNFESVLNK